MEQPFPVLVPHSRFPGKLERPFNLHWPFLFDTNIYSQNPSHFQAYKLKPIYKGYIKVVSYLIVSRVTLVRTRSNLWTCFTCISISLPVSNLLHLDTGKIQVEKVVWDQCICFDLLGSKKNH